MSELLFLAHRIPYPPDKGDKIRSYHLLKALAAEHTVHVGTFVDEPADWAHIEAVQRLCKGETCIRPLTPMLARIRSTRGFLTGQPLTVAYYRDATLSRWVRELGARRSLGGVFAFSACMAQFAIAAALAPGMPRVLDLCDVDSDKWRQYAANHSQPMKAVYAREARTLAAAEAHFAGDFDATLVIAEPEAKLLRQRVVEGSDRIHVVGNGVDTDYFHPARSYERPFEHDSPAIVFTGAMDYHANVDGVRWFVRDVFPLIRQSRPDAMFVIVGSNPASEVRALAVEPGVVVTGRVPDVRPYLAHASVVVAPLRIARGVQNKVLEALAMARPVVTTPNAVQGIQGISESGLFYCKDAGHMAQTIVEILGSAVSGGPGRLFVERHFSWSAQAAPLLEYFRLSEDAECSLRPAQAGVAWAL